MIIPRSNVTVFFDRTANKTHRYDAFIHLDTTRALHALKTDEVDLTEIPDLYPWGV